MSDDKIGLMRLQFWHTAVKAIFANAKENRKNASNRNNGPTEDHQASQPPATNAIIIPDHPVCRELLHTVRHRKLQPLHFGRLIRARERPARQPFVDIAALERYAEESVSCTLYVLADVAAVRLVDVDHALSHLGKAQGIVNMLRAQVLATRQSGVCVFPQSTQLEHGVSQERVLRCAKDDAGVRECVFEVASVAHRHLEKVCLCFCDCYCVLVLNPNVFTVLVVHHRLAISPTRCQKRPDDCCCPPSLLTAIWNDCVGPISIWQTSLCRDEMQCCHWLIIGTISGGNIESCPRLVKVEKVIVTVNE